MKKLILGALVVVTFTLTGCQIIGYKNNDSETNVTQNIITNLIVKYINTLKSIVKIIYTYLADLKYSLLF